MLQPVSLILACLVTQGAGDSIDVHATAAAHEAMSRPMTVNPHLRLTPERVASAADSARAAQLVTTLRSTLARYRDVRAAEADGYRRFLPGVKQPVYHYTNWRHGLGAAFAFEAAKPTSLLYKEGDDGRLELVGAMYTAPATTGERDLDARIPLGIARWHLHVNWCLPPRGARQRWNETRDSAPVFGPRSPIATAEACAAVGGRFVPRLFGWMVHVNAFAGDDPGVIWGAETHHAHDP